MKNLINNLYSVFSLLFIVSVLQAQPEPGEINESMFLQSRYTSPSTPEAASLGQYGDFNVDKFSGGMSLSIPLLSFDTKSIPFNVSLNYNGSGHKVEQLPSWVGLGWNLSVGGAITRTVRGKPDTKGNFFDKHTEIVEFDPYFNSATELEKYQFYQDVEEELVETQADEYNLVFPGGSAKFYISSDKIVYQSEQKDIKIQPAYPIGNGDDISSFTVTDAKGNKYFFTTTEKTELTYPDDGNHPNVTVTFTSVYHLTSITSLTSGDYIQLNYDEMPDTVDIDLNLEKYKTISYVVAGGTSNCIQCTPETTFTYGNPTEKKIMDRRFLREVILTNGPHYEKFVFNHLKNNTQYASGNDRKLMSIDHIKQVSTPYQSVHFNYDEMKNRLRLDNLYKKGYDGVEADKYEFIYNSTLLPDPTSSSIDAWGYYNLNGSSSSLIPDVDGYGQGALRYHTLSKSKAGILDTIKYPTGGYRTFNYESHVGEFGNVEKTVGGLRLQNSLISMEN